MLFGPRNTSGPFDLERTYSLHPTTEGTQLIFRFTMTPRGPVCLVFPMLRPKIEDQVHNNMARLRDLLQRSPERR